MLNGSKFTFKINILLFFFHVNKKNHLFIIIKTSDFSYVLFFATASLDLFMFSTNLGPSFKTNDTYNKSIITS